MKRAQGSEQVARAGDGQRRACERTGYSTPLTMATRTRPSRSVGMLFLTDRTRLGQSWALDTGLGGARNGRAPMMPSEKTNEPTPMSIYGPCNASECRPVR